MSAAGALQKAVFMTLAGDAALTSLAGADGVHDHLQARSHRPCVFISGIDSRDASTASEAGEEHLVMLEVRTGEGGSRVAQEIAARVRVLLDDVPLVLPGFVLVSILHRRTKTGRDAKAKGHLAEMVFRAVTE